MLCDNWVNPRPSPTKQPMKRAISCASWPPAREFNEKGTAYAKETYGKTQAAAGEVTKVIEQTYSNASKGLADFNLHLLESAQTNVKELAYCG
jgi:hypothetical protein